MAEDELAGIGALVPPAPPPDVDRVKARAGARRARRARRQRLVAGSAAVVVVVAVVVGVAWARRTADTLELRDGSPSTAPPTTAPAYPPPPVSVRATGWVYRDPGGVVLCYGVTYGPTVTCQKPVPLGGADLDGVALATSGDAHYSNDAVAVVGTYDGRSIDVQRIDPVATPTPTLTSPTPAPCTPSRHETIDLERLRLALEPSENYVGMQLAGDAGAPAGSPVGSQVVVVAALDPDALVASSPELAEHREAVCLVRVPHSRAHLDDVQQRVLAMTANGPAAEVIQSSSTQAVANHVTVVVRYADARTRDLVTGIVDDPALEIESWLTPT